MIPFWVVTKCTHVVTFLSMKMPANVTWDYPGDYAVYRLRFDDLLMLFTLHKPIKAKVQAKSIALGNGRIVPDHAESWRSLPASFYQMAPDGNAKALCKMLNWFMDKIMQRIHLFL